MEGAAAKDMKMFWRRKWERIWYLIRYGSWNLASNGKV